MRRFVFAVLAGLAVVMAAVAVPTRAGAVTMTAPTGLAAAIDRASAIEPVRWHRHWHRPWWGWHWPRPFWSGWRWHRHHWWHRHYWWGFPFFGPSWHAHPRHHHHRRPHKASQQKQQGEEQKQEEPPAQK